MTVRAVRLYDIAMRAVNHLIDRVLTARSPLQVLDPIISRITIKMAALHVGRRITLEGRNDLTVDE